MEMNKATAKKIDDSKPNGDPTMTKLTDVEVAAAELQQAESALLNARRKHDDAVRRQAPPKKVSEMTSAERREAARKLGISGPM